MPKTDDTASRRLMFALWTNWTISTLAFSLVLILPLLVNKMILPFVVLIIVYGLLVLSRKMQQSPEPYCVLTIRYGLLVLFWTGITMMFILLFRHFTIFDGILPRDIYNPDIPYIVCLILSPLMVLVAIWHLILGSKSRFCMACRARTGHTSDLNVMSALYSREARYQLKMYLAFGVLLCVVQWWYYLGFYINVNMNRSDLFFFNIIPIGVLMFSSVLMLMRYTNMAAIIGPLTKAHEDQSIVRFLVLSDDALLLTQNEHGRWDTPFSVDVSNQTLMDNDTALNIFKELLGIEGADIKYLYSNKTHDNKAEIIHYAIFIDRSQREAMPQGNWHTLDEIQRSLNSSSLTAEFCNEIYRIFTITMAWKTYDRQGRKLYPIKHYRPTFRLRDLKRWTVDYDDLFWLTVATNNQDRPFFRVRKIWQRITGQ